MSQWSVFSSPDRKGVGWEPWWSRPGTCLPAGSGMMHGVQTGAVWDDALGLGRSRERKCGKKIPKGRRPLQAGKCKDPSCAPACQLHPVQEPCPCPQLRGNVGWSLMGPGQKGQWSLASGLGWEIPSVRSHGGSHSGSLPGYGGHC